MFLGSVYRLPRCERTYLFGGLETMWQRCEQNGTKWWFGCFFSHRLGIVIPIDFIFFQRGRAHPPIGYLCLHVIQYWPWSATHAQWADAWSAQTILVPGYVCKAPFFHFNSSRKKDAEHLAASSGKHHQTTRLVIYEFAIENCPVEIESFPMNSMVWFSSSFSVNVYQKVHLIKSHEIIIKPP